MTGQTLKAREGKDQAKVTLKSPGTNVTRTNVVMYKPLRDSDGTTVMDALVLRRYRKPSPFAAPGHPAIGPWDVPDDRKVNPWDLNEPNPTDSGTMGTIPGPVIEANVGDKVVVHFRNMDMRTHPVKRKQELLPMEMRTHSLHPHGFAFAATSDGAYPLSPVDTSQPLGDEAAKWSKVKGIPLGIGGKRYKKGDRVPPGCTFDYTWIAGAPDEEDPTGETIEPWPTTAGVWLYHDHSIYDMENVSLGAIGLIVIHNPNDAEDVDIRRSDLVTQLDPNFLPDGSATGPVTFQKTGPIQQAGAITHGYFAPPDKALYLQLFHTLTGTNNGMLINGRQYLGNTPTLIAGPETQMRFGIVGMGDHFHTFHIHGHRWVIPGPGGTGVPQQDPDSFQNSAQIKAISQFEDTRIFGPANSFVFTIKEGEFFGTRDDVPQGEYHMHCHVLGHMDMGMMGSLLILPDDVSPVSPLPEGVPHVSMEESMDGPKTVDLDISGSAFPPDPHIKVGDTAVWHNKDGEPHTVTADDGAFDSSPGYPPDLSKTIQANTGTWSHKFTAAGTSPYHCNVHPNMQGTITVS